MRMCRKLRRSGSLEISDISRKMFRIAGTFMYLRRNHFETYENKRPCAVRDVCRADCSRAFIKVPVPVVPFTLQFLFTMLAGFLGPGNGALAVVIYIVLGLAGLPNLHAGRRAWLHLQPSFGYIIGFAAAAYVTGRIANEKSHPGYGRLLAANFIGLFIVYAFGMAYYYVISNFVLNTPIGLWPLFYTASCWQFRGYRAVHSGCGDRKTDDPDDQEGRLG